MGWFWPSCLRPRSSPLAHLVVVLYTRPGCHLCDDAKALLTERKSHWGFQLQVTNIDADPQLAQRYGECVPVVAVDGKVRFRGRVDRALFERLMVGEVSRSAGQASRRG